MPNIPVVLGTSDCEMGMTVTQQEEQLEELRESTKQALLKSWEEAESLRAEIDSKQAEAEAYAVKACSLEIQLHRAQADLAQASEENKCLEKKYRGVVWQLETVKSSSREEVELSCLSNASSVSDELSSDENDGQQPVSDAMTRRTSFLKRVTSTPNFLQPSLSNKSIPQDSMRTRSYAEIETIPRRRSCSAQVDECKRNSSWTYSETSRRSSSCSNSSAFGAIGSMFLGRTSNPSIYDEDLMKQLTVLEKAKKETESDLELKIKQREAAILTLEGTTKLQYETISELRIENERLSGELSAIIAQQEAEAATLRGTMVALLSDDLESKNVQRAKQGGIQGTEKNQGPTPLKIQIQQGKQNRYEKSSSIFQGSLLLAQERPLL